MRRHGHNCARAILHQHEVPNPDGKLFVVERIQRVATGEEAFFLHGRQIFRFHGTLAHLGQLRLRLGARGRAFEQLGHQGMRRRKNDGRCPVNRVDARGEDFNRPRACGACHRKFHFGTLRFADPVFLHQNDALGPCAFELLQVVQQLIGIRGGLQKPLLDFARHHARIFVAPAIAAVDHLLVGQHRVAFRAPVHQALLPIRQAAIQHAQEKPLVPAVILRFAGGNLAPPVVAEAEAPQHSLELRDVVVGPNARMRVVLDGRVFCGQTEGVPAHGVQHVETAHALHAGHHIANRVVAHVAHVHRAAGVRQHFQNVVFRFRRIGFGLEHTFLGPALLPLGLNLLRVVAARRSGSRCVLLRHRDYPLLRAFFALCPDLLLWTDPPTFGLEAFSLLRELRAFCDLCVESFFFSAGVSIENPFSASGA